MRTENALELGVEFWVTMYGLLRRAAWCAERGRWGLKEDVAETVGKCAASGGFLGDNVDKESMQLLTWS